MRHIKAYSQLFEASAAAPEELTAEQIDWLDQCTSGSWELNSSTGLVDVRGDFNCSGRGLINLRGIRFGEVSGSFYCDYNQLTTLEGAPQKVGLSFQCSDNQLTSLKGAPQTVGGIFFCYANRLTSLEGAPQTVGGSFFCYANRLTSLEGAPQSVGGFFCNDNQLTTLKGAPETIRGDFSCAANQLTTLEGAPESVGCSFTCDYNQLTSLEGAPKTVDGNFYCSDNPVSETTLKAIFKLMRNGMGYQQALEEYWPKMGDEDRVLVYKEMPNLPQEDARTYKALATYSKIKGYL